MYLSEEAFGKIPVTSKPQRNGFWAPGRVRVLKVLNRKLQDHRSQVTGHRSALKAVVKDPGRKCYWKRQSWSGIWWV